MSEENVEIVRRHIEAFRQGDAPGALSHLDPHVVWDASRIALLDVRVAYGHEEFSQTIRTTSERSRITTMRWGGLPTSAPARYLPS